ncbi:MAG: DEAD/DEAH box helicase [Candidatus Mcinerneyibacterium aminivorans]|uniref:DEAD/DEAH box helicase n=1 Tax=Candidatus Mcinerneyibacterium aminivorans TaxID=2703815 RepID=A0A5D0MC38_9BACT|nr:MAG: DEAD/DEAH box helicase [Candidatus Mcinerneyibacterium aminivorans]
MLKNLNLKYVYDTSNDDLIEDLFVPLLSESTLYFRGVGYFTSGWLESASKGLKELVKNEGNAKIITSPNLSQKDWKAICKGEKAKSNELLYETIRQEVDNLEETLTKKTLVALAWLIADELIEFRFAIPLNKKGDYHNKVAFFRDEEKNSVVIHGSYNDSKHGLLNGESLSVFCSWREGQKAYINNHQNKLLDIWNGEDSFFDTYKMSKAIKKKIVKFTEYGERPYESPIKKKNRISIPDGVKLRNYQMKALKNWMEKKKGILHMATGTGKTFTSLAIAIKLYKKVNKLAVIVSAPQSHLINQWAEESRKFGFKPFKCSGKWKNKLISKIQNYNLGFKKTLFIITTHNKVSDKDFIKVVSKINGNILYIGDECHYLGADKFSKALISKYNYRIGLSATPRRWYDEKGTKKIIDYFGSRVLKYNLSKAIENNFLTEYKYYPILVKLNKYELGEYEELTAKINKLHYRHKKDDEEGNDYLEKLNRDRAKIIKKAANKIHVFKEKFEEFQKNHKSIKHTLVYCAKGEIDKVHDLLLDLEINARKIDYETTPDNFSKKRILDKFKKGEVNVILAMKCLDEGLNIPSIQNAFILASTSNPREFIQRRGRILRPAENKDYAKLYDLVVIPPINYKYMEVSKKILEKEMPRFSEMAGNALNKYEARKKVLPILRKFNLEFLLDLKPWDIYKKNIKNKEV